MMTREQLADLVHGHELAIGRLVEQLAELQRSLEFHLQAKRTLEAALGQPELPMAGQGTHGTHGTNGTPEERATA
jgi:hypothetical protein